MPIDNDENYIKHEPGSLSFALKKKSLIKKVMERRTKFKLPNSSTSKR